MSTKQFASVLLSLSLPALAGDETATRQRPLGMLYQNSENPLIQSFKIGGRFHYQADYVDGSDQNGRDFHDTYDEYRRARIETKTDFLRYFHAKLITDMVLDGRPNGEKLRWGYQNFDEAVFSFDIRKAFDMNRLDALKVFYGRHKLIMGEEVRMSSNEILTVERSALANKVYNSGRPTGVTIAAERGAWNATWGLFSGEDDSEFIGGWKDGIAWYGALGWQQSESLRFDADTIINDESGQDDFLGYAWASAFDVKYEEGRYGIVGSLIGGENNEEGDRGGAFYGAIVMPWYWLVEEKVQAVFQYQYAGSSEAEGVRLNSRYIRAEHEDPLVDVNSGRGDQIHTCYVGINYHFLGHNTKLMGGIEYSHLDTPEGTVEALSYLISFRTYF